MSSTTSNPPFETRLAGEELHIGDSVFKEGDILDLGPEAQENLELLLEAKDRCYLARVRAITAGYDKPDELDSYVQSEMMEAEYWTAVVSLRHVMLVHSIARQFGGFLPISMSPDGEHLQISTPKDVNIPNGKIMAAVGAEMYLGNIPKILPTRQLLAPEQADQLPVVAYERSEQHKCLPLEPVSWEEAVGNEDVMAAVSAITHMTSQELLDRPIVFLVSDDQSTVVHYDNAATQDTRSLAKNIGTHTIIVCDYTLIGDCHYPRMTIWTKGGTRLSRTWRPALSDDGVLTLETFNLREGDTWEPSRLLQLFLDESS